MDIIAILAMDLNNGIGKNNKLPWHIKEEMQFFKDKTDGSIVVMGKNTFLSLKKPLKNRINIVITSDNNFIEEIENKKKNNKIYENVIFKNNINFISELKKTPKNNNVFIIGGKNLYEQTFDLCDKIFISVIDNVYDCDTFIDYPFEEKFDVKNIQMFDEFAVYEFVKK